MTDIDDVTARAEAYRTAQRQSQAALIARDAAIRAALATGTGATELSRAAGVNRVHVYRVRDTGPEMTRATHYETYPEALAREVVEALEAGGDVQDAAAGYDVQAIADVVLGGRDLNYACLVTAAELQVVADAHARQLPRQGI